jgi:hypothetical protein
MVERTHFDAANTTCCDQPVVNFHNKPQYAEASKPMNPKDCAARVSAPECSVLDVAVESSHSLCANEDARLTRIRIACASLCPELSAIAGGGTVRGEFGTFKVIGADPGNVLIVEYSPAPDLLQGWYEGCSGVGSITEQFCGGHTLSYTLKAGLDYPDGCGCDCCGLGSGIAPPAMGLIAPGSIGSNWSNTLSLGFTVSGDEACDNGVINGTFYGSGGATPVVWSAPTDYHGGPGVRYVTRAPVSAGAANNPTCCGGSIQWSGTDGCGGGAGSNTSVNSPLSDSQIYMAPAAVSGNVVRPGTASYVSGWQACSYSTSVNLSVSTNCLSTSVGGIEVSDAKVSRYLGLLNFSGTHNCSGCCGKGGLSVSFSNGCGVSRSGDYLVRRIYSDNNQVGYKYRCGLSGSNYKIIRNDITCWGHSGSDTYPIGGYYALVDDCVASISGANAINISGAGGCNGGLSGSLDCCFYSDNGLSGTSFVSRIVSIKGERCCEMETSNGAWVNSGAGQPCCPS